MRLIIAAVGNRMPAWVRAGFQEYARRMPREPLLELIEVRPERRSPTMAAERATRLEEARVEAVLPAYCYRVVLDESGLQMTSRELAGTLKNWLEDRRDVAIVVGGADGLTGRFKQSADMLLGLSRMTLPHGLARVLLAEQLYRAISIMHNHPYHRD
jgi:23S rRNA (pseudouridine1915-N3)-methyltransferase